MAGEKGQKVKKFNIVDWGIILVLIIGVIGGIAAKNILDGVQGGNTTQKIRYDVEFKYKNKEFVESIQEGDEVRNSLDGGYLGTLIKKEVFPATNIVPNVEEGKYVKSEIPDEFDVIITIEANAEISDQGIISEGEEIYIGKNMYVKGKGYASPGYIVGLDYEE